MTDQGPPGGYHPSGQGGPPEWEQQPPPYGGQSPQYGQPGYVDPQYGQPQYGQPGYGQQQYPTEQYPSEQYPTEQYPAAQYPDQQFGPYTGAAPSNTGGGSHRGLFLGLGTLVVAGIVVLILLLAGVFSSDTAAGNPQEAVRKLLDAGKSNDVNAAKGVLCQQDLSSGVIDELTSNGKVTSYQIGKVTKTDSDHATVEASVTTEGQNPGSDTFPVVKEDGDWKVCLTGGGVPGGSNAPATLAPGTFGPSSASVPTNSIPSISIPSISIPSISIPSISLPSIGGLPGGINPCSYATTASSAAITYVGLAEIGQTDTAQACVYKNSVSVSVTKSLDTDKLYVPADGGSGPTFTFHTTDNSKTLKVTVTKESDGKLYVTKVQTG